jgi:hypothetical protein
MSRSEEKLIFSRDDEGYFHYSVPSSVEVLSSGSFDDLPSAKLLASVTFSNRNHHFERWPNITEGDI